MPSRSIRREFPGCAVLSSGSLLAGLPAPTSRAAPRTALHQMQDGLVSRVTNLAALEQLAHAPGTEVDRTGPGLLWRVGRAGPKSMRSRRLCRSVFRKMFWTCVAAVAREMWRISPIS
jgi:hypothetical protein